MVKSLLTILFTLWVSLAVAEWIPQDFPGFGGLHSDISADKVGLHNARVSTGWSYFKGELTRVCFEKLHTVRAAEGIPLTLIGQATDSSLLYFAGDIYRFDVDADSSYLVPSPRSGKDTISVAYHDDSLRYIENWKYVQGRDMGDADNLAPYWLNWLPTIRNFIKIGFVDYKVFRFLSNQYAIMYEEWPAYVDADTTNGDSLSTLATRIDVEGGASAVEMQDTTNIHDGHYIWRYSLGSLIDSIVSGWVFPNFPDTGRIDSFRYVQGDTLYAFGDFNADSIVGRHLFWDDTSFFALARPCSVLAIYDDGGAAESIALQIDSAYYASAEARALYGIDNTDIYFIAFDPHAHIRSGSVDHDGHYEQYLGCQPARQTWWDRLAYAPDWGYINLTPIGQYGPSWYFTFSLASTDPVNTNYTLDHLESNDDLREMLGRPVYLRLTDSLNTTVPQNSNNWESTYRAVITHARADTSINDTVYNWYFEGYAWQEVEYHLTVAQGDGGEDDYPDQRTDDTNYPQRRSAVFWPKAMPVSEWATSGTANVYNGVEYHRRRVFYYRPNSTVVGWTEQANYTTHEDIETLEGVDPVTGVKSYGQQLVIGRRHGMEYIVGFSADDFYKVPVPAGVGIVNFQTMSVHPESNQLFFYNDLGAWAYDGAQVSSVTGLNLAVFDSMNWATGEDAMRSVVYDNKMWIAAPFGNSRTNNRLLTINLDDGALTFLESPNVNSMWVHRGFDGRDVLYLGDQDSTVLWRVSEIKDDYPYTASRRSGWYTSPDGRLLSMRAYSLTWETAGPYDTLFIGIYTSITSLGVTSFGNLVQIDTLTSAVTGLHHEIYHCEQDVYGMTLSLALASRNKGVRPIKFALDIVPRGGLRRK